MFAPTYLDFNATTPLDARVREAMLPYLDMRFGNASSRHEYGRQARAAIDRAREQVAAVVNAHPTQVIFTSGGSEANNLFIKGAAACLKPTRIAVGAIEHPCVSEPAKQLIRDGWSLDVVPVDAQGIIDSSAFTQIVSNRPRLISIMLANNETGVIQDIAALVQQAGDTAAYFHTDAVQAVGKMRVDFRQLGVQALTVSAHKIGGPQGAGALIVDKRVELKPLIAGGGHERGLRSGTENVAAIVGFGLACELADAELDRRSAHMRQLRAQLEQQLTRVSARIFSDNAQRLPNTTYFAIDGIDGETLVGKLDRAGFAVASGSACSSAQPEPSRTLLAMGVAPQIARNAVRVSIGMSTDAASVERFVQTLEATLAQLRALLAA